MKQKILLLGPQRRDPTLRDAVASLGLPARTPLAAITAGWEEREPEDVELGEHLGDRVQNLAIYKRADDVYRRDPELHEAMRQRHDTLRALQEIYRQRLGHALECARDLLTAPGDADLLEPERADAIEAVRLLDRRHLARVTEIHATFEQRWQPTQRDAVVAHRREIDAQLEDCGALLVAGGHVAILLNRMRLFGLETALPDRPLGAWSAGAMVMTEQIVLFHDSPPQGEGDAEVLVHGFGLCPGVVALPHAARRLKLDDATRVSLFARRFEPAICAALDPGTQLGWDGEKLTPQAGTRVLGGSGALKEAAV